MGVVVKACVDSFLLFSVLQAGEKQKLPTENSVLFLQENKQRSHCAEMGDRVPQSPFPCSPTGCLPLFLIAVKFPG